MTPLDQYLIALVVAWTVAHLSILNVIIVSVNIFILMLNTKIVLEIITGKRKLRQK